MPPLFRPARHTAGGTALRPGSGVTLLQAVLAGVLFGAALSGVAHWRVQDTTSPSPAAPVLTAQTQPVSGNTAVRLPPLSSSPPPPSPPPPPPPSPPPREAVDRSVALRSEPDVSDLGPASYPSISDAVRRLSVSALAPGLPLRCHARLHSDLGGDLAVGVPAQGEANQQPDAGACCASCTANAPSCNVWVWHNTTKACWLKHAVAFPERPWAWYDANSPWTGGTLFDYGPEYEAPAAGETCVHTVLTSNGNSYMNWQTRVMYATWQAAARAEAPGSGRIMTAFTRVLHRSTDDELMQEVPTWRVDPLRPSCDTYCDFPVADRAAALAEWALSPDSQRCSHVMMVETDYLFVRPLPPSILPSAGHAVGFHFGYIAPEAASAAPVCKKFLPPELRDKLALVPQTGNSPQLLTRADFAAMMPAWRDMHARVEADADARNEFTWVRDMYSYSFVAAMLGIRHHVPLVPFNHLMVQPPADVTLGLASILHYTWGPIININGTVLWKFDKREYGGGQGSEGPVPLTKLPEPPKWQPGMRLQANETVTPDGLDLMRLLVLTFNEAVDSLPLLPKGYTTREAAVQAARPRQAGG